MFENGEMTVRGKKTKPLQDMDFEGALHGL